MPRILRVGFVLLGSCATTSTAPAHTTTATTHVNAAGDGLEHGWATWYGKEQQGGPTASGERFDMHAMTAAHRTLPLGSLVRVTNTRNGRSVEVRINDRGPFGRRERIIDLSEAAAQRLDFIDAGSAPIKIEVLRRGPR